MSSNCNSKRAGLVLVEEKRRNDKLRHVLYAARQEAEIKDPDALLGGIEFEL